MNKINVKILNIIIMSNTFLIPSLVNSHSMFLHCVTVSIHCRVQTNKLSENVLQIQNDAKSKPHKT